MTPLLHEKVIETTGELSRFDGQGWDGGELKAWSAILKVIQRPGNEGEQPQEMGYWRREALAYQSGMLADLPDSVPRPGLLRGERAGRWGLDLAGKYCGGGRSNLDAGAFPAGRPAFRSFRRGLPGRQTGT